MSPPPSAADPGVGSPVEASGDAHVPAQPPVPHEPSSAEVYGEVHLAEVGGTQPSVRPLEGRAWTSAAGRCGKHLAQLLMPCTGRARSFKVSEEETEEKGGSRNVSERMQALPMTLHCQVGHPSAFDSRMLQVH